MTNGDAVTLAPMRKRIVIACVAVAVIGGVVVWLSQPRKGSVEWHKREYLSEWNRTYGDSPWDYFRRVVIPHPHPDSDELAVHWAALQDLGYLVDRRTSWSNLEGDYVVRAFYEATKGRFDWQFIRDNGTNPLVLTAPREVIAEFDRFLQSKVPSGGE